jgi:hypothetical protein
MQKLFFLDEAYKKGEQANTKLNDSYLMNEKELEEVSEPVWEAQDHANKISERVIIHGFKNVAFFYNYCVF